MVLDLNKRVKQLEDENQMLKQKVVELEKSMDSLSISEKKIKKQIMKPGKTRFANFQAFHTNQFLHLEDEIPLPQWTIRTSKSDD